MNRSQAERELVALEKAYWQALKDRDVETMVKLTDEPCIVTGAQGVAAYDRKAMAKMMRSSELNYSLDGFQIDDDDMQVRFLRDDVAVIAYRVHEKMTVDGQPVNVDATESSTWVRRDDGWACAMHSEAPSGDPFGRTQR